MKKTTIAIFLTLIAPALFAASMSDVYVIPAAGHATGAGGELWQSDVSIFNPGTTVLNVDMVFVDGAGNSTPLGSTITVAPNATALLRDVVGNAGALGAIVLSGNHAFNVSSRAYATTSRGTYGEEVQPAAEFIDAASGDAFITGLASNASFRSNAGFFAAADRNTPMTVNLDLFSANGNQFGSRAFNVPAGGMIAVQVPVGFFAVGTFDAATARVRISSGSGIVTAYASVIDNATSDAVFLPSTSSVLPPTSAAAKLRAHVE